MIFLFCYLLSRLVEGCWLCACQIGPSCPFICVSWHCYAVACCDRQTDRQTVSCYCIVLGCRGFEWLMKWSRNYWPSCCVTLMTC